MKTVLIMATTAAMVEQFNKENIVLLKILGYDIRATGNCNLEKTILEKNWSCSKKGLKRVRLMGLIFL